MNVTKRYNPIMVVLHWLTVILLLGAGLLSDSEGGGSSPIDIHMILGALLVVTLLIRLIVRFATKRPEWANTGNQFLLILIGGGVIASQRNLLGYMLGSGSLTQGRLGVLGGLHALGWSAVIVLLFLHVGGALYHQFILKDNLFARMWFPRQPHD